MDYKIVGYKLMLNQIVIIWFNISLIVTNILQVVVNSFRIEAFIAYNLVSNIGMCLGYGILN